MSSPTTTPTTGHVAATIAAHHRPWYTVLYIQVLIAIAIGIVLGHLYPKVGVAMKPLGDAFIALIRMMIAPVIFCTVVHGIGSMRDLAKVGRVGVKTLFYFETVSTIALGIGLLIGNLVQPGKGFDIDPSTLDPKAVANYVTAAKQEGVVGHLLAMLVMIVPFGLLLALVEWQQRIRIGASLLVIGFGIFRQHRGRQSGSVECHLQLVGRNRARHEQR